MWGNSVAKKQEGKYTNPKNVECDLIENGYEYHTMVTRIFLKTIKFKNYLNFYFYFYFGNAPNLIQIKHNYSRCNFD